MSEKATQSLTPELSVVNNKVVATSLHVAEVFDKNHFHVLRDIKGILAQVDESFGKSNFGFSEYTITNSLGLAVNKPMVLLTRDGFTLLAMGFTGKRALEFKIAYINAYNAMEQALIAKQNPPVLSPREYHEIARLINTLEFYFHCKGAAHWAAGATLREQLGISSVLKIPAAQRTAALTVLKELIESAAAFKHAVVVFERRFFRSRFKDIPPELLVDPDEPSQPPHQPLLTF